MARIHELAEMYGALADATRLRILGVLADGEVCVCHIHEALRLPQPTVSRHLAHLRRAGLVKTRREGLWIHYRLAEVADPSARAARQRRCSRDRSCPGHPHRPGAARDSRVTERRPRVRSRWKPAARPGAVVIEILEGTAAELPAVEALLSQAGLPLDGLRQSETADGRADGWPSRGRRRTRGLMRTAYCCARWSWPRNCETAGSASG